MDHPPLRLGIDLGGTKIEAALLDADSMVCWKKRIASPREDYAATLAALKSLVSDARNSIPAARNCMIGIGIPGSLSPADGCVRNANSTWLNGQPLGQDLQAMLGEPVQIANDANCLAVSESRDGAAKGARSVFAVILGTGVGGAHVLHGQLLVGTNGIAGEWGHVPLPWMGMQELGHPPCWCGRSGCIETFLSGPALVRDFNLSINSAPHAARSTSREKACRDSDVREVEEIVRLCQFGDGTAMGVMERFHDRLSRALAMVINIIDPEVIVIGGGLSNIASIYSEIPRRWGQWIFSNMPPTTRLVPAQHGDSSGVRGTAWL